MKRVEFKSIRLDNDIQEVNKLKKELNNDTRAYKDIEETLNTHQKACDTIKAKMDALGYDANKLDAINTQKRTLNAEMRNLNDQIREVHSKYRLKSGF